MLLEDDNMFVEGIRDKKVVCKLYSIYICNISSENECNILNIELNDTECNM